MQPQRMNKGKISILYADARRMRENTQTNRAKRGFRSRNVGKTITNCFSVGNLYFQLIFTQERNNTLFLVLVLFGVGCLLVQQKPHMVHLSYLDIVA